MKIVCINNESGWILVDGVKQNQILNLTIGKTYDTYGLSTNFSRREKPVNEELGGYIITDDSGFPGWYNRMFFTTLREYNLNKLVDESSMY